MGLEFLAIGNIVTGGAVHQREERKAGERDTARARRAEKKIADIRTARSRRRSIREARIARANIEASAQASGTTQTSSAASGVAGVGTQLAANLSFLDQTQALATESSMFQAKAAKHTSRAQDTAEFTNLVKQGTSMFLSGGGAS